MKPKKTVTGLLLGFVVLSVVYAIHHEWAARRAGQGNDPGATVRVIAYYLHRTVRCPTCNALERQTHETLTTDFPDELHAGRIAWRVVNFEEHPDLAERFDVSFSVPVLVKVRDGREIEHRRLDEVWTLKDDPIALRTYVADAVRAYLADAPPSPAEAP